MNFTKYLKEVNSNDILVAGGKAVNLGELTKIGVPVPPGFVVLSNSFEKFLKENGIDTKIKNILSKMDFDNIKLVENKSKILIDLVLKGKMPVDVEREILNAFKKLNEKYVAVRSSATVEDSKINSWAGVLETYLNTEEANLIQNIKKCWASLFTTQALFYRAKKNLINRRILVAVVVQKMIQAEISGTCFTVDPLTKDKNKMIIEACWGLGEALVQAKVTPDIYVIDKSKIKNMKTDFILGKSIGMQNRIVINANIDGKKVKIIKEKYNQQKLNEKQIKNLAKICLEIEKYFKYPQDIEWASKENKIYILQSRPITTL
jgi:pyruvate,water dikinase